MKVIKILTNAETEYMTADELATGLTVIAFACFMAGMFTAMIIMWYKFGT